LRRAIRRIGGEPGRWFIQQHNRCLLGNGLGQQDPLALR
jgi:hypothetical protein